MPTSPRKVISPRRQQGPIDECMAELGGLAALPLAQAIGRASSELMLGLSLKAAATPKASASAANVNRVLEVGYSPLQASVALAAPIATNKPTM